MVLSANYLSSGELAWVLPIDSQSAECVLVIIKRLSLIVKIILAFNIIILEISWHETIVLSYTIVIQNKV